MSSRAAAHLQTIASLIWPWFLVWTGLAFFIIPLDIGPLQVQHWVSNPGLEAALIKLLRMFDAIWIVLAAANIYFATVTTEGLGTARRWAGRIVGGSAVLAWIGAAAGWPFGPFIYTDRLGIRIAHVLPFTVPLLWLVLILCSRYALLSLIPQAARWARWQLALATAVLVVLTDLNLEWLVWHLRFYWIWYPGQIVNPGWPPVQNFATWFIAAFGFALTLNSTRVEPDTVHAVPRSRKPLMILALMNLLFLTAHLIGSSSRLQELLSFSKFTEN